MQTASSKILSNSVLDIINSAVIIIDAKLNINTWNNWFTTRSGLEPSEHTGKNIFDLFPDLKSTRVSDAIDNALSFGFPSVISNMFTPTPFPLYSVINFEEDKNFDDRIQQSISVARLNIDNEYYCLIQISDVTASVLRERTLEQQISERKLVEDALLKSEVKHRTIMETMVDGLIVFDNHGLIESLNPAAEVLFGQEEVDLLGCTIFPLFQELSEFNEEADLHDMFLMENFLGKSQEVLALHKDDHTFPVELSISEMQIGENIHYSALIRDITERKKIENLKNDFIATVSHELRTPLTSIRGSLSLVCGGVVPEISDKALELVELANRNCDRLLLLINDILDMEKISSGKMQFNLETFDLASLLKNIIKSNIAYAEQYAVELVFNDNKNKIYVSVDEHRFSQVISNVLSNAAKFSSKNGQVDIKMEKQDDQARISIRDHGLGIPAEFKDKIWKKFTQVDSSNTRKIGGTGLGLAISRSLIEAMHGNIDFDSEENKGTTFYITLPIVQEN